MSAKKKIPELYKAEDIRREAHEQERMYQLRMSIKRLWWLRWLPLLIPSPFIGLVIWSMIRLAYHIVPVQFLSFWPLALILSAPAYLFTWIVLDKKYFWDRACDEVEKMRRLFLREPAYYDALKRLETEEPKLGARIRRMKYVVDPNCP